VKKVKRRGEETCPKVTMAATELRGDPHPQSLNSWSFCS